MAFRVPTSCPAMCTASSVTVVSEQAIEIDPGSWERRVDKVGDESERSDRAEGCPEFGGRLAPFQRDHPLPTHVDPFGQFGLRPALPEPSVANCGTEVTCGSNNHDVSVRGHGVNVNDRRHAVQVSERRPGELPTAA